MASFKAFMEELGKGTKNDVPMRKGGFRSSGDILIKDRLKNSPMGNPRYRLVIKDIDSGEIYEGKTVPNGAIGYELPWSDKLGKIRVSAHRTPKGELVFDNGEYFDED